MMQIMSHDPYPRDAARKQDRPAHLAKVGNAVYSGIQRHHQQTAAARTTLAKPLQGVWGWDGTACVPCMHVALAFMG
jgi:hypothetical protein